jgi:hypothetical protein
VDTMKDSAPQAHPSTDEPRGCFACYEGTVFLTFEEDGHEWTESVPCRRCNADAR